MELGVRGRLVRCLVFAGGSFDRFKHLKLHAMKLEFRVGVTCVCTITRHSSLVE
jgi:hypothetical protein